MPNALTTKVLYRNLSDYAGVADALNIAQGDLAGQGGGWIVVDDDFDVLNSYTVPAGVNLDFRGGKLTVASGKTLTINGVVKASPYQIFGGAGTVVLGPGAAHEVWVEWFGAVGDGVTNDTAAFAAALASLPSSGGAIRMLAKSYAANVGPINQDNVTLRGAALFGGDTVTCRIVPWATATPVVQVANDTKLVRYFHLECVGLYATGPNGVGQIGLDVQGGATECFYDKHSIIGFSDHDVRVSCNTQPITLQFFSRFKYDAEAAPCNSVIKVAQPSGATSYTTSVYFSDGHINGPATNYDTGTATGGSTSTLVDTGKSWATNAYAGAVVKITGGTGSGQYGYVASNTATTLTLQGTWTTPPDATSTFTIFQGYTLDLDGVDMTFHNVYCDITDGRGVRYQKTNAGAVFPVLTCGGSVEFDGGANTLGHVNGPTMPAANHLPPAVGATYFNGSFLAGDGTLVPLPTTSFQLADGSRYSNPHLFGSLYFDDGNGNQIAGASISQGSANMFVNTPGSIQTTVGVGDQFQVFQSGGAFAGGFKAGVGLMLPTYTTATRPSASGNAGAVIYVSDGGAGNVIQASNGAAWVSLG